jgi:Ca2+-binding RTX toxin-like protein
MRRTIMILAIAATAVVVCSGLAVAKTVNGGGGNDQLLGTGAKDTISGGGGDDDISGKGAGDRLIGDSGNDDVRGNGGPDRVYGGTGSDDLYGNKGNDFHNAFDEQPNDTVRCGSGNRDVAIIDIITQSGNEDRLFGCEFIYLPIPICGCPEERASQVDLAKLGPEDVKGAVEDGLLKRKAR